MARYKNRKTGVTVSVRDDKTLDRALWEPVAPDGGFATWKVDDLRSEIARRNEGRDDTALIPTEGKKADLVAALEADDENA